MKALTGILAAVVLLAGLVVGGLYLKNSDKADSVSGNAGPESTQDYYCYGGLCTYNKVGSFQDATTTLFSVLNPFNATSTVMVGGLDIVNGTTTVNIRVGTSTVPSLTVGNLATPSLVSTNVSTSTKAYLASGVTQSAIVGDQVANGAIRVIVGPGQYIVGQATSTSAAYATQLEGVVNPVNTFSGTYFLRFER